MGKDKTKRCSWYFLRDQNKVIKTKSISTWWGARAWVVTFQPGRWLLVEVEEGFISPRLQTTITTETTQAWSQPEPACNHVGLETLVWPGCCRPCLQCCSQWSPPYADREDITLAQVTELQINNFNFYKSLNHSTAPLKHNLGKWSPPSKRTKISKLNEQDIFHCRWFTDALFNIQNFLWHQKPHFFFGGHTSNIL